MDSVQLKGMPTTTPEDKSGSTDNDVIIARILQEEFDFEYEVTKRAMTSNSNNAADFNFQSLLPKLGSFLSLNDGSKIRIKSSNIPKCFSFYSEAGNKGAEGPEGTISQQPHEKSSAEAQTKPPLTDANLSKFPIEIDQSVDYENFVTLLNSQPELANFNQSLRRFIQEFVSLEIDMLDQIQVLNEFFVHSELMIAQLPLRPQSLATFQEMSERLVMNKVYYRIFELEHDRERSESLSESIKKHSWMSHEHLDLPEQYTIHEQLIARAIDSLIRIDSLKSPAEKLAALAEASKTAFQIITADPDKRSRGAATDDFLPLIIYFVLKAQPSRLYSNVQYIARFKRKESPEDRYFFTTLLAAVSFIEKLSHKSLTISREEYAQRTEQHEEPLFEVEGIKIKNVFKKPFNSVSKWLEREFSAKSDETIEDKERQQLAVAIELSLQENKKIQK